MRLGIECEVSAGALDTIECLYRGKQAGSSYLHEYHCCCPVCTPDREWNWTGQEDSTVDGEIISRILTWGPDAWGAIDGLAGALAEARAEANPLDGKSGSGAGNHVHVENVLQTDDDGLTCEYMLRLLHLFWRYGEQDGALDGLASAGARSMRGYNSRLRPQWDMDTDDMKPRQLSTDGWLRCGPHRTTVEFRLWNATTVGWRLHMHAGLSVGMMSYAIADPDEHPDVTEDDDRHLLDVLRPFLDADTITYAERQMAYAA